jgi:peptidoglycan/LPS O-acetylase OafA/YrhL
MATQPVSRAGRGILYIIVGAILIAGIAIFIKNVDAVIDAVDFYIDIRVLGTCVGVIALVGAGFWLRGHQVYAKSKGHSAFWGFVLGLLPVLGLVVLAALPGRRPPPEHAPAVPSEPEAEAAETAPAPSEGEQQNSQS